MFRFVVENFSRLAYTIDLPVIAFRGYLPLGLILRFIKKKTIVFNCDLKHQCVGFSAI